MNDLKAVIEVKSLEAKCNLDPCFIKLILKQSHLDVPVETGKLESKKELVLRNGRVDINESFELRVKGQTVKDNKVIVIVMASKGKDISLLGVANIDFRKINTSVNHTQLDLPLEKCTDTKAELSTRVRFSDKQPQSSQQTSDFQRPQYTRGSVNSNKTAPVTTTAVPSNPKQQQPQSAPNTSRQKALQISRRNYKQSEILRESKKQREHSKERSGSYKKRFQYQEKVRIASKNTTTIFAKRGVEKELVPRQRTPEPIRFETVQQQQQQGKEVASRRESNSKGKIREGLFSRIDNKYAPSQKQNIMDLVQQQSPESKKKQQPKQSPSKVVRFADGQAGSIKHQISVSSHSRSASKDKYAQLADKLEQIEQKLQKQKQSLDLTKHFKTQPSDKGSSSSDHSAEPNPAQNSICTFGQSQDWKQSQSRKAYYEPSVPSVKIETSKQQQPSKVHSTNEQTQSLKTSMQLIQIEREYERARQEKINLEEGLEQAERRIQELEAEKQEAEKVMEKLAKRYEACIDKHAHELDELKESYQRNLDSQAEEMDKIKKQLRKVKVQNDELKAQLTALKSQATLPQTPTPPTTIQPTASEDRLSKQRLSQLEASLQKQKRQVNNLSTNVRMLQNELKFAKLREDSLKGEKKQLQQQIKKLQSKNMNRKQSRAELQQQFMSGYPTTLRAQNKLLREQIDLLQKHNDELNAILEKRERDSVRDLNSTVCTLHEQTIAEKNAEIVKIKESNKILQEKYNALLEKTQIVEEDLIRTKNNFCEAMNVAFEKGGSELVDLIESKMTFRQEQNE